MASIYSDERTNLLIACITVVQGQRRVQLKKTTGTSDKKTARRIADELEDAAQGRRGPDAVKAFLDGLTDLKTRRIARRSFDDVMRKATGRGLDFTTTRAYVGRWLEAQRSAVAPASFAKYDVVQRRFLESLEGKADVDMRSLEKADVMAFRDKEIARVSASTVKVSMKIIRMILTAAEADGVMGRMAFGKNDKAAWEARTGKGKRRGFTVPELLKLLDVCDDEWRSMVLFGFYTGARLGDIASLTWENIDGDVLMFAAQKTRRPTRLPLAEALKEFLLKGKAGDDPRQPLHANAHAAVERGGHTVTLSGQFHDLLTRAGLVKARSHEAKKGGKGRSARRATSELSFHSLRHTATSLLKSAGVGEAVARDIIGHESAAMSRHYTHIEDGAKRDAVNLLPDLVNRKKDDPKEE